MRKIISVSLFCALLVIIAFLLFGNIEKWVENNLSSPKSLFAYACTSFIVLASDIILPVPSSLVMILNGKILGIVPGTIVSLLSGLLASSTGFYLGRKSQRYLDKFFSPADKEATDKLFNKFGNAAIIISRALPVFSETVSFVSGTTSITFKKFFLYALAGHFITSFIYACAGRLAGALNSNIISIVIIGNVVILSWIVQLVLKRRAVIKRMQGNYRS